MQTFKFRSNAFTAIFAVLLFSATVFTACSNHSATPSDQATPSDKTSTKADSSGQRTNAGIYYCPMDPEIVSDKPGICPKCNMDLELKEDNSVPKQ